MSETQQPWEQKPWVLYPNVQRLIMQHAGNRWRLALTTDEAEELTAIIVNHPTSEVRMDRIGRVPVAWRWRFANGRATNWYDMNDDVSRDDPPSTWTVEYAYGAPK